MSEITIPGYAPHSSNPILPGYYADPSLIEWNGVTYIYATENSPENLGFWKSSDFKNWTHQSLNWPTKSSCQSPTSGEAGVWAPSVVCGKDGKFYMAVTVSNEVWLGIADHPEGPWHNLLGDKPLVPQFYKPGYHMIDAEYFIDDDGSVYLYWGSGLGWVNGICLAVKLKEDMMTFDGEPVDITPKNYFEAPFIIKRNEKYLLMYSQGVTIEDSYQVHYAISDHPLGPFTEAPNSPILVTDKSKNVVSPGHHAVFTKDGQDYILYHRHSIPFNPNFINRQICVDRLDINADGLIEKIVPTHEGPAFLKRQTTTLLNLADNAIVTASSQSDDLHGPERILDYNYATRWAAKDKGRAWLQMDLRTVRSFKEQILRLECPDKAYSLAVEVSVDGEDWEMLADHRKTPVSGSPVAIRQETKGRYLRLSFDAVTGDIPASLFEWQVY